MPLWWITTSPYRAALQSIDPSINDVRVPVNLTFHYESTISLKSLQSLIDDLANENPELRINSRYESFFKCLSSCTLFRFISIDGEVKSVDDNALNIVLLTTSSFISKFPNAMMQTRGYFVDENMLTVNYVDSDSLFALISRVLGTERFKSITNPKLQVKSTHPDFF